MISIVRVGASPSLGPPNHFLILVKAFFNVPTATKHVKACNRTCFPVLRYTLIYCIVYTRKKDDGHTVSPVELLTFSGDRDTLRQKFLINHPDLPLPTTGLHRGLQTKISRMAAHSLLTQGGNLNYEYSNVVFGPSLWSSHAEVAGKISGRMPLEQIVWQGR